jgi:hypothetical protein
LVIRSPISISDEAINPVFAILLKNSDFCFKSTRHAKALLSLVSPPLLPLSSLTGPAGLQYAIP